MSLNLPFGIQPINALSNIDVRYGPWASLADARTNTAGTRVTGLTVGVNENGGVVEYWFKEGIGDNDLVEKTSSGGGMLNWSGSTANAVGTYISVSGICAQPNLTFNGSCLNVTGKVITDTLQVETGAAAGCVLISDASGNATWQTQTITNGVNGLSKSGNNIVLGGNLTGNTQINLSDNCFDLINQTPNILFRIDPTNEYINYNISNNLNTFYSGKTCFQVGNLSPNKTTLLLDGDDAIFCLCSTNSGVIGANATLNLRSSGATITDLGTNGGIRYSADYSNNYVARSLVDKNYVDTCVGSAGGINMSGSTANGLTTYVNSNTICAQPNLIFNGSCLGITGCLKTSCKIVAGGLSAEHATGLFQGKIDTAINYGQYLLFKDEADTINFSISNGALGNAFFPIFSSKVTSTNPAMYFLGNSVSGTSAGTGIVTFEGRINNAGTSDSGTTLVNFTSGYGSSRAKLMADGTFIANGKIIAGTGCGFYNATYQAGINPIWAFDNATGYGISYCQGGVDDIRMHFGSPTTPSFCFAGGGNLTITGCYIGSGAGLTGTASNLAVGSATTAADANCLGGVAATNFYQYQCFNIDADTMTTRRDGFTYALNAPSTGPIIMIGEANYSMQINSAYIGGGTISYRTRNGDAACWNPWYSFITTANIASQSVGSANNSACLGGIAATRYLYGSTCAGSNSANAGTYNPYEISQYKSGFWEVYNAAWMPTTDYYWALTAAHTSNGAAYNYSGQLAWRNGTSDLYTRTITNGTAGAWRKVFNSGDSVDISNNLASGDLLCFNGTTITGATNLRVKGGATRFICWDSISAGGGSALCMIGQKGASTSIGGAVCIFGGEGGSTSGGGGALNLYGGNVVCGNGGSILICASRGCGASSHTGGNVTISAGLGGNGSGNGGNLTLCSGAVVTGTIGCVILSHGTAEKLRTLTNGVCVTGCGFATDFIASSDLRLKTDIQPISNALSIVTQLCGVSYIMCDDENQENRIGLIAQEVQPILPEVVSHTIPTEEDIKYGITDDKLGIKYDKITAVLIEAIKEQQLQINDLNNKIIELQKK